jgi:hypothetical protein
MPTGATSVVAIGGGQGTRTACGFVCEHQRVYGYPMTVSIPEKTLEHWCSQYLTYRYNSLAALWWPTSGQDIDVRWLPLSPGKQSNWR